MAYVKENVPFASKGHVTIEIKNGATPGSPTLTAYTAVGCLVGDVSLQRTWANEATGDTVENWCTIGQPGTAGYAEFVPGEETITSGITIEADITSSAYNFLYNNEGNPFNMRFTLENEAGDEQVLEFLVVKTSDTIVMRGGDGQTTQLSFDIQAIEEEDEVFTPA